MHSAQSNLSLPLGEMSRSDREGWNQLTWLFRFSLIRICLRAALSVICFANASSPKGRAEKPERIFALTHNPTCLSLWERCRAATERAGSLFEGAGLPPRGKTEGAAGYLARTKPEGVYQIDKKRTFRVFCERFFLLVGISPRNPARRQSAP